MNEDICFSDTEKVIIEKENILFEERKELRERERELIDMKLKLRENTLISQFNNFSTKQDKSFRDAVNLNPVLLHAAVKSYYYDIHRYKDFTASKWANSHKQAAYTIKWLVKFRPIQINEDVNNITEKVFDANLIFALLSGFSFLDRELVDLIMKNKTRVDLQNKGRKEGEEHERSFYDKLLYILRYKPLSGKMLISIFESLELVYK